MSQYRYSFEQLCNLVKAQAPVGTNLSWSQPEGKTLVKDNSYISDPTSLKWRLEGAEIQLTLNIPADADVKKVAMTTQATLDYLFDLAKKDNKHIEAFFSTGTVVSATARDVPPPFDLESLFA